MAELVETMPMADYQAAPALSASGIWSLVDSCPATFLWQSPWNPERPVENKPEFDIGTALHLAVLEPAEFAARTVFVPYDTYASAWARELRDEAWAADKTPLKPKEAAIVEGMTNAVGMRADVVSLFRGGLSEVSLFWDWSGVPCKARADYLSADRKTIVDLKSAESANPRAIARKAFGEGWFVRDPWYREAVSGATGVLPKRYVFVVVEKSPPHLIELFELDEPAIEWGRQAIRSGLRKFARCVREKRWPGYGNGPITLSLPTWAEYSLADRSSAGEFDEKPSAAEKRTAREMLAP